MRRGRLPVIISIVLLSCLIQGGAFAAPDIAGVVESYLEKRIEAEGKPFLDAINTKLKYYAQRHDNYFVRTQLHDISGRLEDTYADTKLVWNDDVRAGSRKSSKTFLTKTTSFTPATNSTTEKRPRTKIISSSARSSIGKTTDHGTAEDIGKAATEAEKATASTSERSETKKVSSKPVPKLKEITPEMYVMDDGRIDVAALQQTWVDWVNVVRKQRKVESMSLEPILHKTAADRSRSMKEKGKADHKRFSDSGYYTYSELEKRFEDRGVVFANIKRATFTENVGYATFSCNESDCTDSAISALRSIFEYFRGEEGEAHDVHRRSMIHPYFYVMGLGIAVDEEAGILYTTIHYGTEITQE